MRLDQFIQGNDVVQQHVAAERGKQALTAVSPMARRAIGLEIIPQIEESVTSVEVAEELCESTKRSIEAAFSYKNEIYTRLISYKSIDQSDQQYLEDCLIVMDEWLRSTKSSLHGGEKEESPSAEKQQVEVTIKVESQPSEEPKAAPPPKKKKKDTAEDEASKSIVFVDTNTGEVVPLAFDDIFDLQDVRL
jgi:hypothetical protein